MAPPHRFATREDDPAREDRPAQHAFGQLDGHGSRASGHRPGGPAARRPPGGDAQHHGMPQYAHASADGALIAAGHSAALRAGCHPRLQDDFPRAAGAGRQFRPGGRRGRGPCRRPRDGRFGHPVGLFADARRGARSPLGTCDGGAGRRPACGLGDGPGDDSRLRTPLCRRPRSDGLRHTFRGLRRRHRRPRLQHGRCLDADAPQFLPAAVPGRRGGGCGQFHVLVQRD